MSYSSGQNVGFPQANGSQPYQHVQQFNQFSSAQPPLNNGAPPNSAPFPSSPQAAHQYNSQPAKPLQYAQNGVTQPQYSHPQSFPAANVSGYQTAQVNGFPSAAPSYSHPVPPGPGPVTSPSAFPQPPAVAKPMQPPPPSAFPTQTPLPPQPTALPSAAPPTTQPMGYPSAAPSPPQPSGYPGAPQPSAYPNAAAPPPQPVAYSSATPPPPPAVYQHQPPLPQAPAPPQTFPQKLAQQAQSPRPYGMPPPQQHQPQPQQYGQPGGYPGQNYPSVQQTTQQFGQMGLGGPPGGNYRSDVVDLMAERNVHQYGFEDIDVALPGNLANPEARVDPNIFRCTLQNVPQTEELLKKSRLPLAITLHPFRDIKNLNIIQTSNIVRCRYCRTYINPYVTLPDHRHWRCNLCNRNNDLPDDFCWDPVTKSFGDPRNRPEIRHATVEFIAPSEYTLRPPQPPLYTFILDVSASAIQSGYLHTFSEQLLINLDHLPGEDRAQVAFVAVDSCLHFFSFNTEKGTTRELIVDDTEDPFLPSISEILVPLKKSKELIRSFVKQIPSLFTVGPTSQGNCLGPALNMIHQLIAEVGGRISVFQCSMPTLGAGNLQTRENLSQGDNSQNFLPANDFYKNLSLECTGHQIALDLFAFNTQYADLASLSEIAKFSTGCVYHFPNYNLHHDEFQRKRFEKIFTRYLTRKIGFEAVLRIRTSRGLALTGFHGNFFVRSPDLLAYANCNPDSALAAQLTIEEKLQNVISLQSALLYTSSKGDRRIRVHTMCLPTTPELLQLYNHFDLKATISYVVKMGAERSMAGTSLADSREAIVNAVVDSLGSYQKAMSRGSGLLAPREGHLRLYPSIALAMLKHKAFSSSKSIKVDERIAAMLMVRFAPLEQILSDIYPKLYRLNELAREPTSPGSGSEDSWPAPLPLSFEHIQRDGVYLMEAGNELYLYVGSNSDPSFVQNVFGRSYDALDQYSYEEQDNDISQRVFHFIKQVTALKFYIGPLVIVKEHSPLRELFVRRLIDDRSESSHSYVEFLQHLKREISS